MVYPEWIRFAKRTPWNDDGKELRQCDGCGKPIYEGRNLCDDCRVKDEKEQWRNETDV